MSAIDQHRAALEANPDDARAFEALEEHYFMSGEWDKLVAAYESRLRSSRFQQDPAASVPLLFRLAQVLEERCLDPDRAIPFYWQVAKLDPSYRPALRQLRGIHTGRKQWDMVLQIAEMESQLPMQPHELATFMAELGNIWLARLDDPNEAIGCFKKALAAAPVHAEALRGLARSHEQLAQHLEAAAAWEKLGDRLRGPDRAPVLVSLANLLIEHLDQPEQGADLLQRALRDDPRHEEAVEALSTCAGMLENWELLAELAERRFDLAAGARRRSTIAVEAGRLNLEKLDNTQVARMWLDRAVELSGDDAAVWDAIADLERRTGDRQALAKALENMIELAGQAAPPSTLLEAAELQSEHGNEERALEMLRQAHQRAPQNPAVVEALSENLMRLDRREELVQVLEQRVEVCEDDPEAKARVFLEMARIQEGDLGNGEAAIASLSQAFEASPTTPGIATALERLYRGREEWERLHDLLLIATEVGPEEERSTLLASLGEVRGERRGDVEGASRAFEAALEIDPHSERALRGLERIAIDSGNEDDVLRAYEREAQVTTDRARLSHLVIQLVPLLEARERNEDALGWAEKLNQMVPEDVGALQTVARLREALGRKDELREALERLDPLLPADQQSENRKRLASLHAEAGRPQEAISCHRLALENAPNDVESLCALEGLYRETRDVDQLVPTLRRLADLQSGAESIACLEELATLLESHLGDLDGAIVILWRLNHLPAGERPEWADERLENLLERAGRFEELAQQLMERRRSLQDGSHEARALDLRRAQLLLEPLGQCETAAALFRSVRALEPDNPVAARGLEKALRSGNDAEGLVDLLAEQAAAETDRDRRGQILLERAGLLEEALGDFEMARESYNELALQYESTPVGEEAGGHLEQLLVRCGDWLALCERLERKLGQGTPARDLELHEELARLYRDRLNQSEFCIEHWEAAARLAPENATIWHNLAIVYGERGRNHDLLRVIECELETGPDADREAMLRLRAARLCAELDETERRTSGHYERLLELEPGHVEASEFLIGFYERVDDHAGMVRLLTARLEATPLGSESGDANDAADNARTSLRLRIANLRAESMEDLPGAIEVLEPALEEIGHESVVAAPLADLYQRAGDLESLTRVCRGAAGRCQDRNERAAWLLRLGDALRCQGDDDASIEAYRAVLVERSGDRDAESALRELYRETGRAEPLAELLQMEIARRTAREQVPMRMELAQLLARSLDRPEDAFEELKQVLALEPAHGAAFEQCIELARRLERPGEIATLLDQALARSSQSAERAALLEQTAELYAGSLDQPGEAIARYREALTLDPSRREARSAMRVVLEAEARWPEVLDCLFLEAQTGSPEERTEIFQRAVELSRRELHPDAALPWLERLHAENPRDVEVLSQIADIHRQAGRPESLLRNLDSQLDLTDDARERRDLLLDRSRILERDMTAPGRALSSLEEANSICAGDPEVLEDLDRLYDSLGRERERVGIVEERIECAPEGSEARSGLHRTAAVLWSAALARPELAVPHLMQAIDTTSEGSPDFLPMLRELSECLRADGQMDAWARAAERELARQTQLQGPDALKRRHDLHRELAQCYEHVLGRHVAAQRHLLALLEVPALVQASSPEQLHEAELALLDHMRRDQNRLELERRLGARLERVDGDADSWLELARLRAEWLHSPSGAAAAYREVLEREPECLAAIRGLRHAAELLLDWKGVADALEREIELPSLPAEVQPVKLLRRLGDLNRYRVDDPGHLQRAAQAYQRVLELDHHDLETLHALQQVYVELEEYPHALDLYEMEIDVLGDQDAERRLQVWLRAGELARDHTDEPERALEAYRRAANCGEIPIERQREWAELERELGGLDRYAAIFAGWCDADDADAECGDHLDLAEALCELGRPEEALARVRAAIEVDRGSAAAWERAAELEEESGDLPAAAECLAEAAEIHGGTRAARQLLHAAELAEAEDSGKAADLLCRAAEHDAALALVQAELALVYEKRSAWEEVEAAAGRALDLATDDEDLEDALRLDTALAGGRAAWRNDALESAARFFATALAIEPQHVEALEAQGEVLFQCGDVSSARHVLEARLALPGDHPDRAHHLAIVAQGFELEENHSEALERFGAALEEDPKLDEAHEGLVRIHESRGDVEAAIQALGRWTEVQEDASHRAEQRLHAAQLELARDDKDRAESELRGAVEEDASKTLAWTLLCELMWDLERQEEALDAARGGLAEIAEDDEIVRPRLALVEARALEATGDKSGAAAAYARVLEGDRRCSEAALARARLLRELGDWTQAADALVDYLSRYPEPETPELASVHYKLGRLLAGPLERVEEAVAAYERALALDGEFTRALEPLANLLTHIPERWADAIERHRSVLEHNPFHHGSLRALLTIAERQRADEARVCGLAILRALGSAAPDEFADAPDALPLEVAGDPKLSDADWEKARRLVKQTSQEVSEAIAASDALQPSTSQGPVFAPYRSYWDTMRGVMAELSAPGFEALSSDEIAATVQQLGALALDASTDAGDRALARSLERSIGRWSRRKLRKLLEGLDGNDLAAFDWPAWHAELRLHAAAIALDRCEGDLRSALVTLSSDADADGIEEISNGTNITERARGSELATSLLQRVVMRWCGAFSNLADAQTAKG